MGLGSGIRKKPIPDPGSRIQGSKTWRGAQLAGYKLSLISKMAVYELRWPLDYELAKSFE
jgi:hypothetical protein